MAFLITINVQNRSLYAS